MHHENNAVIMQTKQLGWIETLEEKLHALEGHCHRYDFLVMFSERTHNFFNFLFCFLLGLITTPMFSKIT